jgi:hypothetical protein
MKMLTCYSCLLFFYVTASSQNFKEINPVLHDNSYIAAFGRMPDETTDEQLRIRTHLSYTEQILRETSITNLAPVQRANRNAVLDMLHEYWLAGIFPVNRDHPGERRPCFIDADGKICAVGYLVQQTKGRAVAEMINQKHQYDFLLDMNEPAIEAWAQEYGLTLEECAMIQPAYGPPPAPQTINVEIKTGYGVSSGLLGGGNIAITIANLASHGKYHPVLSYAGIIAGTGQIMLGAANIKKSKTTYWLNGSQTTTSYKQQNNLSYANIALGTTTIVSSALNLIMNINKKTNTRNAFNLYSYPNYSNSVTMGLSFTRQL